VVVIVNPCEPSYEMFIHLHALISKNTLQDYGPENTLEYHVIEHIQKSESAWILFTRKKNTQEQYVIKLLCNYSDPRYCLETLERRQSCQEEAFVSNSKFSPDVYLGLANTYTLDIQNRCITISHPTKDCSSLSSEAEFALVMRYLPSNRRLDWLLENSDHDLLQQDTLKLVKHVVRVHDTIPALSAYESEQWGSFDTIQLKLKHNLSLADPIFTSHHTPSFYSIMRERFSRLQRTIPRIFTRHPYATYFAYRVAQGHIKHCHGDLKGPNIWIEPYSYTATRQVAILDAIDFNPMYSNIDTLSDFATLVVDVQTRLRCTSFASALTEKMINLYLQETQQYMDEAVHVVLRYYLVEKAFVSAAISIVYDDLPELGMYFLQVAERRLNEIFMKKPVVKYVEDLPAPPKQVKVVSIYKEMIGASSSSSAAAD
jgi:aminoglycoside phosphotransferase family enzyme